MTSLQKYSIWVHLYVQLVLDFSILCSYLIEHVLRLTSACVSSCSRPIFYNFWHCTHLSVHLSILPSCFFPYCTACSPTALPAPLLQCLLPLQVLLSATRPSTRSLCATPTKMASCISMTTCDVPFDWRPCSVSWFNMYYTGIMTRMDICCANYTIAIVSFVLQPNMKTFIETHSRYHEFVSWLSIIPPPPQSESISTMLE